MRSPMVIRNDLSATVGCRSTRRHAPLNHAGELERRGVGGATRRRRGACAAACRTARPSACRRACCRTAGRRRMSSCSVGGLAQHGEGQRSRSHSAAKRARCSGAIAEHVALLRLVAPDLHRRHARLFVAAPRAARSGAPRPSSCASSGSAFDRPPAPTSWIEQDGVAVAQLPAAVDDFLRAPLHLRVAALHRGEVEVRRVAPGRHRRRRAAAQADEHARAAQLTISRRRREARLVRRAARGCCRGRRRS